MFYIIYKITNKISGKTYIGSHKTNDLEDGYMGSGKYLKRSIEKNSIENFKKEILFVFDNPEAMFAKEAELVNEDYLTNENTYNLKIGGFGGWDWINKDSELVTKRNRKIASIADYSKRIPSQEFRNNAGKRTPAFIDASKHSFLGKSHSDETKTKMSLAHKNCIPWNKGIPRTEETKKKISIALKKCNTIRIYRREFKESRD